MTALGATLASVSNVYAQTAASTAADNEQAKAAELAKKLQKPVASLISVPIQNNWDFGIGAANAMRYTVNIQPVIPFSLTKRWSRLGPALHDDLTVSEMSRSTTATRAMQPLNSRKHYAMKRFPLRRRAPARVTMCI